MSLPPAVPGSMPEPWRGGRISERVRCVLAPNPGPMTLDGTNTYVVGVPGGGPAVVVDPGPDDPAHLDRVFAELRESDHRAGLVLLTHGHPDHAEAAVSFARRAGCPVRAVDPAHRLGSDGLTAGDRVRVGGVTLEVLATPGHTSDSVCLVLADEGALLTGDTVLGRGTTVVAHPDGRLDDYLQSLRRLEGIAASMPGLRLLPGHGPAGARVAEVVPLYLAHRAARLDQVVAAVRAGARDVHGVVADVYADVDRTLWPAARLSVRAQVDYLLANRRLSTSETGLVVSETDA